MATHFQYSCLENPMGTGAWRAAVHGVTKELDTTEWLTFSLSLFKEPRGGVSFLFTSHLMLYKDWACEIRSEVRKFVTSDATGQKTSAIFQTSCGKGVGLEQQWENGGDRANLKGVLKDSRDRWELRRAKTSLEFLAGEISVDPNRKWR